MAIRSRRRRRGHRGRNYGHRGDRQRSPRPAGTVPSHPRDVVALSPVRRSGSTSSVRGSPRRPCGCTARWTRSPAPRLRVRSPRLALMGVPDPRRGQHLPHSKSHVITQAIRGWLDGQAVPTRFLSTSPRRASNHESRRRPSPRHAHRCRRGSSHQRHPRGLACPGAESAPDELSTADDLQDVTYVAVDVSHAGKGDIPTIRSAHYAPIWAQ